MTGEGALTKKSPAQLESGLFFSAAQLLRLYRAVSGTVILALVDQWVWSRAGYYTGPSVWDRDERGPGVLGVRGLCEEKASG